jgi:hypothetical protein
LEARRGEVLVPINCQVTLPLTHIQSGQSISLLAAGVLVTSTVPFFFNSEGNVVPVIKRHAMTTYEEVEYNSTILNHGT